ncbi:MAG: mechanosensitive ion channel family protein [Bacteroidota bacterium]
MILLFIDLVKEQLLGVSLMVYLRAAIIILAALFLRRYLAIIVAKVFFTVFKRIADKEHIQKFKELLRMPIQGMVVSILFFVALNQFGFVLEKIVLFERHKINPDERTETIISSSFSVMDLIDHLFFLSFIFYGVYLAARIIGFLFFVWVERARAVNDRERQQLLPLLRDVLVVLVWGFGFFTVLGVVFHVNVPTLIAGLGFGGVAIAFAAKESLENLLASFMIMVDKPFTIGDHIKIGSVEGRAEQIGFRSTRIRTMDQTLVSLPNKNLIGTNLENFSERGKARVKLKLNANYGLSQNTLKTLIQELKSVIDTNQDTIGEAVVYLENFGSTIEINTSYFVQVPSAKPIEEIKQDINLDIYKVMYQHAQGFGFPAQVSINSEAKNELEDN